MQEQYRRPLLDHINAEQVATSRFSKADAALPHPVTIDARVVFEKMVPAIDSTSCASAFPADIHFPVITPGIPRRTFNGQTIPYDEHNQTDGHGSRDKAQHNHSFWAQNNTARRRLIQASVICAIFMIIEVIFGLISNSLALLTDASHMLSDLSSFLISLFALWAASQPGTSTHSFGFYRAEILGACISVLMIWIVTGYLVLEAVDRIMRPQPVNGEIMLITALIGTAANVVMTYLLGFHSHGIGGHHNHEEADSDNCGHTHSHDTQAHDGDQKTGSCENRGSVRLTYDGSSSNGDRTPSNCGNFDMVTELGSGNIRVDNSATLCRLDSVTFLHKDPTLHQKLKEDDSLTPSLHLTTGHTCSSHTNVNLRAAYVHAVGDLIQNIGVIIAALVIWIRPEWTLADPICTFMFSVLVAITTFSIIGEVTNVLMEGTPVGVDLSRLRLDILKIPAVIDLHDLHVWSLSIGKPALACHIVVDEEQSARRVLRVATSIVQKKYFILHTTIQVDFSANDSACDTDAHVRCL